MANKLNQILCGPGGGANTGVGDCPYQMKPFIGFFITPRGFRIPKSTAEDPSLLSKFLKDATMAPAGQRIYPVQGIVGMPADNSSQDTVETLGYGRPITILEGNYAPQYQHYDGGVCLQKNLRKFNKRKNLSILFIDSDFVLVGTMVTEANTKFISSIPLFDFKAEKIRLPNGQNVAGYFVNPTFAPRYINEDIAFVETSGFDITSIAGLQDVVLTVTKAAQAVTVSAVTSCGGVDLYEMYEDQLKETAAWKINDAATGAVIPITSVTSNDGVSTWTLETGAALPASVIVNLAPPLVLAEPPISVQGFEGIPVTV